MAAAAEEDPFWGAQFSVSSPEFAALINGHVSKIGFTGLKELNEVIGPSRNVTGNIQSAINTHITSDTDDATLPIILMIKYPPGSTLGRLDPRNFAINDYVIVFTHNEATATNTSAVPGIYRVTVVNNDDTVTVAPSISANTADLSAYPVDPQNHKIIPKTRCALLRKYNDRLIVMVRDPSAGGAKSGGSRRKRIPSRSKSVNKKRKYTQQRVRRRSHRRRSHRR
jgi:hypothetical protein